MRTLAHQNGVILEEPEYFGSRCFAKEASSAFHELAAELNSRTEDIHAQVSILRAAACEAIERGDLGLLEKVFEFLDHVLAQPNLHPEIENAIAISFLSPNEFERSENGTLAWARLPERLKRVVQFES